MSRDTYQTRKDSRLQGILPLLDNGPRWFSILGESRSHSVPRCHLHRSGYSTKHRVVVAIWLLGPSGQPCLELFAPLSFQAQPWLAAKIRGSVPLTTSARVTQLRKAGH